MKNTRVDPFNNLEKGTGFGDRLKEVIGNRSGRAFAKEVNISYSTLHNYLTNVSLPTLDNLITLAKYAGVSIEWLATGEETENCSDNDDFVEIEDCRDIRLSAGNGGFNSDYTELTTTKVERAWLQSRRLNAENCAMFLVSGESMYPTLKDGEEIIVDRSKRNLVDGKIFVLNNDGSMLVKKVQLTYDGVELISDNPTYRPLKLEAEEANNLIVIGQVVRGYRDF
ncbi:XRE family transcriptional regulator [Avibacterium paragallinarum]|uniref:XRE family transcriptional regulator n=1 Tax=Avibacterium paragallinarum TaxID=728 RepID=UPI00397E2302